MFLKLTSLKKKKQLLIQALHGFLEPKPYGFPNCFLFLLCLLIESTRFLRVNWLLAFIFTWFTFRHRGKVFRRPVGLAEAIIRFICFLFLLAYPLPTPYTFFLPKLFERKLWMSLSCIF